MKFLVTGTLRSKSGPRRLCALTLLLFLAFAAVHFAREFYATGLAPAEVRRNLYGTPMGEAGLLQSPRSPLMILEDLHVDLLLYSVLFLFIGSLLVQSRFGPIIRKVGLGSFFFLILSYLVARILTAYFPWLAYSVGPLSILFHGWLVALIGLLLYDLYAPMPKGSLAPPTGVSTHG